MINRPGISLLLTLFVLSAILVAALSAGNLIFRELRITTSSDQGIRAFYAAESGLEQALFAFRRLNETNLTIISDDAVAIGSGRWWRESQNTINELQTTLLENDDVEVALFDPSSNDQAQSVRLEWIASATACPGVLYTWLEVVQSYWDVDASASQRTLLSPQANDPEGDGIANGVIVNLAGNYPYVRLRSLFGDACGLRLQAFTGSDGTGSVYALPEQIEITSTGEVGDTRQSLSVTVPAKAAQFGAFDYTIFSEQPICKDVSPCN